MRAIWAKSRCTSRNLFQVARIEKRGYDAYTLTTPRRYVQALGDGFSVEVRVRRWPTSQQWQQSTRCIRPDPL
jgi:hypothetical protein